MALAVRRPHNDRAAAGRVAERACGPATGTMSLRPSAPNAELRPAGLCRVKIMKGGAGGAGPRPWL